jgi:hypothetical protein
MTNSSEMDCKSAKAANATLAKPLAPEEIRQGDFVTPLWVIAEIPSFWWRSDSWTLPIEEPVRIRFLPNYEGMPLKVRSVCVPFVLVKAPSGEQKVIDLRSCQLAKLDKSHAMQAWKALKCTKRAKKEPAAQQ